MFQSREVTNARRHAAFATFRRQVWDRLEITPFPHQADWMLAAEGLSLFDRAPVDGERSQLVQLPDGTVTAYACLAREGGAAHVLTDLAAFKAGKSFSLAMFLSGFAAPDLPGGASNVDLIGLEYDTSEPEFDYLSDFLLSEKGMNLEFDSHRKNKKEGAMWITLKDGRAHFEVKSYRASRKSDAMKGKTRDCYCFTEAYQLPGLEVYSRISQNLRQRDGFACFATTPDRAWVTILHDKAHGKDPHWHCVCDESSAGKTDASCNPFTFDQAARDRDDPDKGGLMTRERFDIAWRGKVKRHIGMVYDYSKDAQMFHPLNMPHLWTPEAIQLASEVIQ
jgi:hypothetical protein